MAGVTARSRATPVVDVGALVVVVVGIVVVVEAAVVDPHAESSIEPLNREERMRTLGFIGTTRFAELSDSV